MSFAKAALHHHKKRAAVSCHTAARLPVFIAFDKSLLPHQIRDAIKDDACISGGLSGGLFELSRLLLR